MARPILLPYLTPGLIAVSVLNIIAASALFLSFSAVEEATTSLPREQTKFYPKPAYAPALSLSRQTFRETLQRPVFSKTRRPFEGAHQPLPVVSDIARSIAWDSASILKGVLMVQGRNLAYITSGKEGYWIAEGATVKGWKLLSVNRNKATLVCGDQKIDLQLYEDIQSK